MADFIERIIIDDTLALNPLKNIQENTEKITKRMKELDEWTKKTLANMSKEVQDNAKVTQETALKTIAANNTVKKSFMDKITQVRLFGVSIDDVKGKLNDYKTKLTDLNKGISSLNVGLTKGSGATRVLATAFKVMSGAIAATGIGALILALGTLITFFTRTQRGMDIVGQKTAYLRAAFTKLTDIVGGIGGKLFDAFQKPQEAVGNLWKAIKDNLINRLESLPLFFGAIGNAIKSLFSADWDGLKQAGVDAGSAIAQSITGLDKEQQKAVINGVKDLANQMNEAGKAAERIKAQFQELNREKLRFVATEASINRQIAQQREISKDTTKSLQERINAATKAGDLEDDLLRRKIILAEKNLKLVRAENALGADNDKDLEAEMNALAELDNLKTQSATRSIRLNREENQLIKQALGDFEKMGAEIMDVARAKNLISKEQDFNIVKAEQLKLLTDYVAKLKEIGTVLKIDVSKEVDLATQIIEGLNTRVFQKEVDLLPTIPIKEIKIEPRQVTIKPPTSGKKKFDWDAWWDELEGFDDLWSTFLQKTLDIDGPEAEQLTKGLNAFVSEWGALLDQSTQIHLEQLDKQLDGVTERKDKLSSLLDEERDNYERGLANNYLSTKATYDNLIAEEERLNTEKEKLQAKAAKRQLIAETAQQTASLITSSINIIKGFSNIPVVGLPLGIAAVASLLAFFVKTKADAFKATKLYTGAERINDYFGFGKRDGESDLPGSSGKGYRLVSERTGQPTNTIISGREMLIPEKISMQNEGFFQNLRTGMYNGIDLSEAIGFYKTFKVPQGNVIHQNNTIVQNSKAKNAPVAHLIPIGNGKYLVYELGKDQGHGSIIEIKS